LDRKKLQKYAKTTILLRDPEKLMKQKIKLRYKIISPTKKKEIIREKEVIVKIRCPYCKNFSAGQ
jgi:hypothetical protein